jgi:kumamolisin
VPDCGWANEASLDIDMAHAMAPQAKIVLVESATNSDEDMNQAVQFTNDRIDSLEQGGNAIVSKSWGSFETDPGVPTDYLFQHEGVVYIAGSGDWGASNSPNTLFYPATSPYVIAAGGTSIIRGPKGNFLGEIPWATTEHCDANGNCYPGCTLKQLLNGVCLGGGGGLSGLEARPSYQDGVRYLVGKHRGIPDFSADADPKTGVATYDSFECEGYVGWQEFGGTSVSAPLLAGIMSSAGSHRSSTVDELTSLYNSLTSGSEFNSIFRDIVVGFDGIFPALPGYDLTTGLGSPKNGLKDH